MAWFETLLALKAKRNGGLSGMFAEEGINPEGTGALGEGPDPAWANTLAAEIPQPSAPSMPAPEQPFIEEDPNNFNDLAPDPRNQGRRRIEDQWRKNKLVRLQNEPTSDYRRRLSESDPEGERDWRSILKQGGAGVLRGMGTLPTNNPRIQLGGGNYAGAAAGGAIGGVLMGLLDPDGQAEQWRDKELGQLRQQESDDLKVRETEADINYKNTQARELPKTNATKANATRVKQLQAAYSAAIRGGQGFDAVNNEQHRALADAMKREGIPALDLPPDIKDTRWVYDNNTQQDILEYLNKDGTWRTARMGEKYKSEGVANRDAAVIKQERDRAFTQEMEAIRQANRVSLEETRQGNRLEVKKTPGAKATGGSSGVEPGSKGTITDAQLRAKVEAKLPPDATEKEFRSALNRAYREATEKMGLTIIPTPGAVDAPVIEGGAQAQ